MNLNYDALSEPVTEEMIKTHASKHTAWIRPKVYISIGIVLYLFMAGPVIVGGLSSGQGFGPGIVGMLIIVALISVGVVAAAIYGSRLQAQHSVRMKRFAEANGGVYQENVMAPQLNGMIFDEGHSRTLEESISFKDGIEIGNYTYVKGSGKNQTTYTYSFARVALNRNLPHMVLDAKSNNFFGSNLPDSFDSTQRLTLEGDFNNHFNVYVPNGYETDALYVFTPDVMAVLVDHGSKHDMEIIGEELFIFKSGKTKLADKSELESVLSIVSTISNELRAQSKRYVDDRVVQSAAVASQGAASGLPVVADEGRRLKQKFPVGAFVFIGFVMLAIFLPPLLPQPIADAFMMYMWLLLILALAIYGIVNIVRSK